MAEIKKVGVLGCGLMGSGIAQVAAAAGYGVERGDYFPTVDGSVGATRATTSCASGCQSSGTSPGARVPCTCS